MYPVIFQWVHVAIFFPVQKLLMVTAYQCGGETSTLGKMLRGHTFSVIQTLGAYECLNACNGDVRCQSVNFVISSKVCEMNNRTKEATPIDFVSEEDRFYMKRDGIEVSLGSIPELPAQSCSEIKSSEGGAAVSGEYCFDSIVPGKVVLAFCDMNTEDIDECSASSQVCDVNARCTNSVGSYNCACNPPYNGNGIRCTVCSSIGPHCFEKVQDLPTRGASSVVTFEIAGSRYLAFANHFGDVDTHNTLSYIYKMDDSTERFTLYQSLQTHGAQAPAFFTIADQHFLALPNQNNGVSSQIDSLIYQWNGTQFVIYQKLLTNGANQFTAFKMEDKFYLCLANAEGKSAVYEWENATFHRIQEIETETPYGCAAFMINNETFIVFSNNYGSQLEYAVHSTVFRWSAGHFVKHQSLQTYGARRVHPFTFNNDTFLAFGNFFSGSVYNIDSFIYKWDGNDFTLFQSIPTRAAHTWNSFVISGQMYLGVANYFDDIQGHNTLSIVYQASGGQFIKYQEIPTHGGHEMTTFEHKGQTYMAVANFNDGRQHNINSALYKWT